MKEKLNRLAKGIMDDAPPAVHLKPERVDAVMSPGRKESFSVEVESREGRNLKGAVGCDDWRVSISTGTILGRLSNVVFGIDTAGLSSGDILSGEIWLVTNAGEFSVPYRVEIRQSRRVEGYSGENQTGQQKALRPVLPEAKTAFTVDRVLDTEYAMLLRNVPQDAELLTALCSALIREGASGELALALFGEAIRQDLRITRLYESYMAAVPDEFAGPIPMEVLLYYQYEKKPGVKLADRLYANIIRFQPRESEVYASYEPAMRDHAAAGVLAGRITPDLAVIYDRMLYPDMIDEKAARILPDLLESVQFRVTDPAVRNLHVRYHGLRTITAGEVREHRVCLPVYFDDAVIECTNDRGQLLRAGALSDFDGVHLLNRTDLLRRCFELDPSHPMLRFGSLREILKRGVREEKDRALLISFLEDRSLAPGMRSQVIRTLLLSGGDPGWLSSVLPAEIDPETGLLAFRGFLAAGRLQDAYRYLKRVGYEKADPADLSRLAEGMLAAGLVPVEETGEPDRFFPCLVKYLFDRGMTSTAVFSYLGGQYQGSGEEMVRILTAARKEGQDTGDLAARAMVTMLFAGTRTHLDEVFSMLLSGGGCPELLMKAYFTLRMSDYFEDEDTTVPPQTFDALGGFLSRVRDPGLQPVIYALGLSRYYAGLSSLDDAELALCQKLVDLLIERGLVFPYVRLLGRKVHIPETVNEKYYVEYRGTPLVMEARVLPGEPEFTELPLKKTWKNIYVASGILFPGEQLEYRIYDRQKENVPAASGTITVKKMQGPASERYARLSRMASALEEARTDVLRDEMIRYQVETEMNRELFRLER